MVEPFQRQRSFYNFAQPHINRHFSKANKEALRCTICSQIIHHSDTEGYSSIDSNMSSLRTTIRNQGLARTLASSVPSQRVQILATTSASDQPHLSLPSLGACRDNTKRPFWSGNKKKDYHSWSTKTFSPFFTNAVPKTNQSKPDPIEISKVKKMNAFERFLYERATQFFESTIHDFGRALQKISLGPQFYAQALGMDLARVFSSTDVQGRVVFYPYDHDDAPAFFAVKADHRGAMPILVAVCTRSTVSKEAKDRIACMMESLGTRGGYLIRVANGTKEAIRFSHVSLT